MAEIRTLEERTYSEKLRDPRWQKKRLLVLKRDKFSCKLCGDKDTELHVHHKKYTGDPWEAPMEDLQALCKQCHKVITGLDSFDIVATLKIGEGTAVKVRSHNETAIFLFDFEDGYYHSAIERLYKFSKKKHNG